MCRYVVFTIKKNSDAMRVRSEFSRDYFIVWETIHNQSRCASPINAHQFFSKTLHDNRTVYRQTHVSIHLCIGTRIVVILGRSIHLDFTTVDIKIIILSRYSPQVPCPHKKRVME